MWRLRGKLAVNCSTLVDLPRQTHGLRWMRDELMAPPNRMLTPNGADDVQHWQQTLSGWTSIEVFHPCNMLHGWKDNSMLAKPLAACTYLSSILSELYDA